MLVSFDTKLLGQTKQIEASKVKQTFVEEGILQIEERQSQQHLQRSRQASSTASLLRWSSYSC